MSARFIILLIAICPTVYAQKNYDFPIVIHFVIENAGLDVDGTLDGMIHLEHAGNDFKLIATASPQTIKTGIALRDRHLQNKDYFDVASYPSITMRSVGIQKKSNRKFIGKFSLRIKSVTRELQVPFMMTMDGDSVNIRGEFKINRREFLIGASSPILSDEVLVTIGED